MASYLDLLRSGTQNTGGATSVPGPVVSTTPTTGGAGPTPTTVQQLFPEYFNPDGTIKSAGVTSRYTGTDGNSLYRPTTVSNTRTTPETHPWLYANNGYDVLANKDYGNATYSPGGVATGFPTVPQLTAQQQQAAADAMNYYRNGGMGLDPALMQGMTRTTRPTMGLDGTRVNQWSNPFGTYTAAGWDRNPTTGEVTFRGSNFSGADASGNPINYGGNVPYGSAYQNAVRGGTAIGGLPPQAAGTPNLGQSQSVPPISGMLPTGTAFPGQAPQFLGLPSGTGTSFTPTQAGPRTAPDWWTQLQSRIGANPTGLQTAQAAALRSA